jgi:aromatic-amino-acid transaminase
MLADLEAAAPGTAVVLHACCHNPTGVDLDAEQWADVAAVVAKGGLVPFLDMAYQGFWRGLEPDAAVVRAFTAIGVPVFVATSMSKNLGLYGERVGSLSVVAPSPEEAARTLSQLKVCVRTNYSNPPTHGAAVASLIFSDERLFTRWEEELAVMRERVRAMRALLAEGLAAAGYPDDVSFITDQVGMFSYTGLTPEQMDALRADWSVYGTRAGRICVAALNARNVERVVAALVAVASRRAA